MASSLGLGSGEPPSRCFFFPSLNLWEQGPFTQSWFLPSPLPPLYWFLVEASRAGFPMHCILASLGDPDQCLPYPLFVRFFVYCFPPSASRTFYFFLSRHSAFSSLCSMGLSEWILPCFRAISYFLLFPLIFTFPSRLSFFSSAHP